MLIQHFLDYLAVERKYSPRTVEAYHDDLQDFCRFLAWEIDEFNPKDVQEDDVKTWMLYLLEEQHQAPRSVKRKLSALRSFYKFLLRQQIVSRDVTARVTPPKADKPLPVFFRKEEMAKSQELERTHGDTFEDVRDNLIIEVLYQTGMRQAELLGLTDADWDLAQGQVRVFGKRRKERIVPIGDALIAQIKDYLSARAQEISASTTFFVHRTRQGEWRPLTKSALYTIVRNRMGEVSTLKKHSPHVLRHTFATAMLDNGADIRTIQELLGHASLSTTQIYTHATFEQVQKAYMAAHPRAKKK